MFDEFYKMYEPIKQQKNKDLREKFKAYIKPNFMIRLKEAILKHPDFTDILISYNPMKSLIFATGTDDADFDVCVILAVNNWYILQNKNEEEKSECYKDKKYEEFLINRTIKQCYLLRIFPNYKKMLYLSYMPNVFIARCIVEQFLKDISKFNVGKTINKCEICAINFLNNMLYNIKAVISLIEDDNITNAIIIYRTLLESFCVFNVIKNSEHAIDEYYKFLGYKEFYDTNGTYPKEILKENINYLNYGWLDVISDKKIKYTFQNVLNSTAFDENMKDLISSMYKYCCNYSHGKYKNKDAFKNLLWVMGNTLSILEELLDDYNKLFNKEMIINGIDLKQSLKVLRSENWDLYDSRKEKWIKMWFFVRNIHFYAKNMQKCINIHKNVKNIYILCKISWQNCIMFV